MTKKILIFMISLIILSGCNKPYKVVESRIYPPFIKEVNYKDFYYNIVYDAKTKRFLYRSVEYTHFESKYEIDAHEINKEKERAYVKIKATFKFDDEIQYVFYHIVIVGITENLTEVKNVL